MRKTKIFMSLVAAILICFCLTACASEKTDNSSSSPEAQLDAVEIRDDDSSSPEAQLDAAEIRENNPVGEDHDGVPEIDIDQDIDWSEDEQDENHAENPGMHDGYYHEVGGARFYTEHDINQWLKPDERHPELTDFDIEQMLIDLWCQNGGGLIENDVGFSYTNREEWAKGIWFEVPDENGKNTFHMATILYAHNGVEYTTSIRIYNYPQPISEHSTEYYAIMDQYYRCIHSDMAPLILLAIERMEADPYDGVLNDLNLDENFCCN